MEKQPMGGFDVNRRAMLIVLVVTLVAMIQATALGQTVNLTFSMWGGENFKILYEEMVEQFQQTHPHINVEIISIPFNEYHEKLVIMRAGNAQPDLGWVVEANVDQFIGLGMLEDISAIENDPAYMFDDIIPATLDLFRSGGKLYGVPFSNPPFMIFYNKTMFEEKGLKTPTELYLEGNWTLDTLRESALALTDKSKGTYGAMLFREWKTWDAPLTTLFRAYGGDLFDDDGNLVINSPENVAALTYLEQLIFVDESHPKPGDQLTFESGKVGLFLDVFSQVSNARLITDFEWDVAPIPRGPAGYHPVLGQAGYAVFRGTKNREAAEEFLKFLTSVEGYKHTAAYFVPPRVSILNSDEYVDDGEKPSPESRRLVILEQLPNARIKDGHPKYSQINEAVRIGLDQLYSRSLTPAQTLEYIEESILEIIL